MRVLHVIPYITPRYGGPPEVAIHLVRALREEHGISAEIASTDADGQGERLTLAGSNPHTYRGVPLWLFRRQWTEMWKYSRPMANWLNTAAREYDLVHVHGVFSYSTLAACRAAARCRRPVVLSTHGMLSSYSLSQSRCRKWVYWQLLERRNVRRSQTLHTTAPGEMEEARRLLPTNRVECIPLGVDEAAWRVPRDAGAFRRQYAIPADRPLLLFLARLHRIKGLVELLLPAMAQLSSDAVLAVVGGEDSRDPGYVRRARETVERLNLTSRVFFTGPIFGEGRWAAYDDADVYLLPSAYESFGITVIEAMARGTPVVVCPGVQSGYLVQQAQAGVVAEASVSGVAAAIRQLLDLSPATRVELGGRAASVVRGDLGWGQIAGRFVSLYQQLQT